MEWKWGCVGLPRQREIRAVPRAIDFSYCLLTFPTYHGLCGATVQPSETAMDKQIQSRSLATAHRVSYGALPSYVVFHYWSFALSSIARTKPLGEGGCPLCDTR